MDGNQFFFRTTDDRVEKYLKLFTLVPLDRIDAAVRNHMVRLALRYPC